MKTTEELEKIIEDIYWTIGRADPTDADLRGAAKQVAALIESKAPDLAQRVCAGVEGWKVPLFP